MVKYYIFLRKMSLLIYHSGSRKCLVTDYVRTPANIDDREVIQDIPNKFFLHIKHASESNNLPCVLILIYCSISVYLKWISLPEIDIKIYYRRYYRPTACFKLLMEILMLSNLSIFISSCSIITQLKPASEHIL